MTKGHPVLDGENKTILSLVNGEGVHITLHRDHTQLNGVANLRVVGKDGQIVLMKLNRDNRYRLRRMLEVVGD